MIKKAKTVAERQDEDQIRSLSKLLQSNGISVRREKLTRGQSFRVKSGGCFLSDQQTLFVDKNLPIPQQLSVLIDYLLDKRVEVPADVLQELSPQFRSLLVAPAPEAAI